MKLSNSTFFMMDGDGPIELVADSAFSKDTDFAPISLYIGTGSQPRQIQFFMKTVDQLRKFQDSLNAACEKVYLEAGPEVKLIKPEGIQPE